MSKQYHIHSENTKYYIISETEKEGDTVVTVDGKISTPEHSVCIELSDFLGVMLTITDDFDQLLTITPPLGEEIVTGTVRGVNGLYVALPKVSRHSTSLPLSDLVLPTPVLETRHRRQALLV